MKTNKILMAILAGALAFGSIVGCGEDEIDPGSNNGGSGGTVNPGGTGGGGTGGSGGTGGTGGTDGNDGGTGGDECVNGSDLCDECAKWEEDPLNFCAASTEDCLPFDNADRVPGWPNVPQVN